MDKQAIRERVWDAIERAGVARFPFPPHDRIPNFADAETAADRLADTHEWQDATTLKSNPDAPQLPVRRRALRETKPVFMAVPRLSREKCFMALDPERIEDTEEAATISGADQYAEHLTPQAMPEIDLIIAGSVAVTQDGDRIGKGEGYSDLEFAILAEAGLVGPGTTVATTVHEMQILSRSIGTEPHDVPMDLVVTPEAVIRADRRNARPDGIDWSLLEEQTIEAIPILQELRPR